MEIDLVYLWVNGSDPVWQEKRNNFIGKTEETSSTNCEGRYADNDELKYSLRSVDMYAPWIRKIFIITDNQIPKWLNTSNPKIKIVDHKEIMPSPSLPCFNSSVIEHFICRIPELAEHFLYANDDMFINKPVTPDFFFEADGLPIIRFSRRPFRKLYLKFREKILKKKLSHYNQITQNSARLVEKKYKIYYSGKAHHNIDGYLKSDCIHTEEIFKDEIGATLTNQVRNSNDIQRHLYYYVSLAEQRGHLHYVTQKTSFRFHIHNEGHYNKLIRFSPTLFCMNDSEYAQNNHRIKAQNFLASRFPTKSQFEK